MWITNSVAVRGKSHIAADTPCQDRVYVKQNSKACVAALCDGAGSYPLSHYGAEVCCKTVSDFFLSRCEQLYEADGLDTFRRELYTALLVELEKTVQKLDCDSIKELSCTMLSTGVFRDKLFTVHIGDGVIILRSDGELLPLSEPENGEYSNQTFFITGADALEHLRMNVIDLHESADAVFLMSDGAASSLYGSRTKKPSAALNSFADMCKLYSPSLIGSELLDFFENTIRSRTTDDCSLCMLVKHRPVVSLPRRNLQMIVDYLYENGPTFRMKLVHDLHRSHHRTLSRFNRDLRYLAESGFIEMENDTVLLH